MKKTISTNIAGTLFQMDEDAYSILESYLHRIEASYNYSAEGKEIVSDLEFRLSELFMDRTNKNTRIITSVDVNWAIGILGRPEDLGAHSSASSGDNSGQPYSNTYRPIHRLYRDTDNRVIGGVCSGLGAYFDVDQVLIRVCFVILFFLGFGPLAYIIMWIALPKARTVTQKLEMHGLPPTPENIRRFS